MLRLAVGLIALLLASLPAAGATQAQTEADAHAAAEPVMRQLEAFRRGDFDTAYTFASPEIQALFDRQAFEQMVRSGYPEIAQSAFAAVVQAEPGADGHVLVRVKIRGANGRGVEAAYDMVKAGGRWTINGVRAWPDDGLI